MIARMTKQKTYKVRLQNFSSLVEIIGMRYSVLATTVFSFTVKSGIQMDQNQIFPATSWQQKQGEVRFIWEILNNLTNFKTKQILSIENLIFFLSTHPG